MYSIGSSSKYSDCERKWSLLAETGEIEIYTIYTATMACSYGFHYQKSMKYSLQVVYRV